VKAKLRFATRTARAAPPPRSVSQPLIPDLHLANVYVFDDLAQVDAVWDGREPGYVYGRFGTPNHTRLEDTLASLEGGEAGLVAASGMGALSAYLMGALRAGDHLVAGQDLYGTTVALLREQAARWGIRVTFADTTEPAAVEAAITQATRAIFVEAVSNPLLRLADLPGLAEVARRRGLGLLVDSTFASPALLRPLEHGATAVHHSATKYLSGHGDVTAGVLVGSPPLVAATRAEVVRIDTVVRVKESVEHAFIEVSERQKEDLLLAVLDAERPSKCLVFTATREKTSELARRLRTRNHEVVSLSSLLSQANRERALHAFRTGVFDVLVATDVAARGLDIDDIDLVVNFDAPMHAEEYVHRIGRTGRAHRTGKALTLVTEKDGRRVAQIESLLGHPVKRATVEGFAFTLPPASNRPRRDRPGGRPGGGRGRGGRGGGGRRRAGA
jgi:CheY-like chemotaxis protein